jgi:hypothetical protein
MGITRASVAAILLMCLSGSAWAAADEESVCLVTFASAGKADDRDIAAVAAAAIMPRSIAAKLVNGYSKIFDYRDESDSMRACTCLSNPAPANSIPQRQASLLACPKPERVE